MISYSVWYSPPGPICFEATRNQQKNHRPKYFFSFEMYFISFCILFYFFPISESLQFWQNAMADFCSYDFAVWQVHAVLKRSIEIILRIELKQSHFENLESVPAVFAKWSWNFHPSPCGCSALAGNRQYITGLSIYYRDMPCFDGLYLKNIYKLYIHDIMVASHDFIHLWHYGVMISWF